MACDHYSWLQSSLNRNGTTYTGPLPFGRNCNFKKSTIIDPSPNYHMPHKPRFVSLNQKNLSDSYFVYLYIWL